MFTARRIIGAASMALVAATLATPASAHELDEDAIAAKICPAGISSEGSDFSESADSGDEAEVDIYSYGIGETPEGDPVQLCTFAIISTDEDSKLNGTYTLGLGASVATGGISGNDFVTKPLVTAFDAAAIASVNASGKQLTPKTSKQRKAAKTKYDKTVKSAQAKYTKSVKAAKKKFSKAKPKAKAKAKTAMNKKIAAAKTKLASAKTAASAAQKRQTSPTERSYSLKLTLPFND